MSGRSRADRRGRRNKMAASLTITSMMDMFTLILLFLLVFFDPENQADSQLELPTAHAEAKAESGPRVRVARDRVSVDGREVGRLVGGELDQALPRQGSAVVPLVEALQAARAAAPPRPDGSAPALMVECDKQVAWSVLAPVLASAADAGFPKYRLLVLSED